jgi:hypothetical protein
MQTANDYRTYADLCINLAKATDDEIERRILDQIAMQFRRLANRRAKPKPDQEPENSN